MYSQWIFTSAPIINLWQHDIITSLNLWKTPLHAHERRLKLWCIPSLLRMITKGVLTPRGRGRGRGHTQVPRWKLVDTSPCILMKMAVNWKPSSESSQRSNICPTFKMTVLFLIFILRTGNMSLDSKLMTKNEGQCPLESAYVGLREMTIEQEGIWLWETQQLDLGTAGIFTRWK